MLKSESVKGEVDTKCTWNSSAREGFLCAEGPSYFLMVCLSIPIKCKNINLKKTQKLMWFRTRFCDSLAWALPGRHCGVFLETVVSQTPGVGSHVLSVGGAQLTLDTVWWWQRGPGSGGSAPQVRFHWKACSCSDTEHSEVTFRALRIGFRWGAGWGTSAPQWAWARCGTTAWRPHHWRRHSFCRKTVGGGSELKPQTPVNRELYSARQSSWTFISPCILFLRSAFFFFFAQKALCACNPHPSPFVKVDVAILPKEEQDVSSSEKVKTQPCRQKRTHIQAVFDGRVQHGEVGQEDSQVWHGALSVGLRHQEEKKCCICLFTKPPPNRPTKTELQPAAVFQENGTVLHFTAASISPIKPPITCYSTVCTLLTFQPLF